MGVCCMGQHCGILLFQTSSRRYDGAVESADKQAWLKASVLRDFVVGWKPGAGGGDPWGRVAWGSTVGYCYSRLGYCSCDAVESADRQARLKASVLRDFVVGWKPGAGGGDPWGRVAWGSTGGYCCSRLGYC